MFIKNLILTMFNFAKKIIIEIDINNIVLSVIISQLDEKDRLYLIIFCSKKFTILELNYNIYDKKSLIIINSFKVRRTYLKGLKYRVTVG